MLCEEGRAGQGAAIFLSNQPQAGKLEHLDNVTLRRYRLQVI